jgi:hypothetical protein
MSGDPLFRAVLDSWDDDVGYRRKPVEWAREVANIRLWSMQAQIIEALRDHRYVAVHSCHDSGKTLGAAIAGAWWIDSHPVGQAFLVSTAPTQMQVGSILWREIITIHNRAQLQGRINRAGYPRWFVGNREVGYGRKPSEYEASTFQGLHAKYPLVVIDEAGGISKKLYDDVDTLVTNANGKVLAIGNPDDPSSHFAEVCGQDTDWHVIHIDGLRTPNIRPEIVKNYPLLSALLQAEGVPYSEEPVTKEVQDALLNCVWIEERLRRWCGLRIGQREQFATEEEWLEFVQRRAANSPMFLSKVRGVFAPAAQANKVVPLGWVELAQARWRDWDAAGRPEQPGRRINGVDPARFGEDESVIAPRQGHVSLELHKYAHADTMETANNVAAISHIAQSLNIIDDIGVGAGVIDRLREMKFNGDIQAESEPFTASKNSGRMDASGEFKFRNDRAAAWWRMRELLDPSRGSKVCLPPDDDLKVELTSVEYQVRTGGIITVETKEEVKRRLGRSTDSADAVIQSYWVDGVAVNAVPADIHDINGPSWAEQQVAPPVRYAGYTPWDFDEDEVSNRWDLVK